jgi:hypothetical protein
MVHAQTQWLSEIDEVQRLNALLPPDLTASLRIVRSPDVNPALITTVQVGKQQFAIQVDWVSWGSFPENQRDVLFWHEVARIQCRTVHQFAWEMPVMIGGLAFSLTEIAAQNIIPLVVGLVMAGLAGNQLYQRHRGEQSLRAAAAADQQAIVLAVQCGYSFRSACNSLYDVLHRLAQQTADKSRWKTYQVRLRALEILESEHRQSVPFKPSRLRQPA